MPTPIFTDEQREALRERRAFTTPHLFVAHTKGGTYVIASNGKWNDNGRPRDLLAILPGDIGQGQVLRLYVAVSDDLVAAVEAALVEPVKAYEHTGFEAGAL